MKRREFLHRSTAGLALATLGTAFGGVRLRALAASPTLSAWQRLTGGSDRVFVLIQLTGGNDGLNTIIPIENPLYYQARPTLAIPKNQTLPLTPTLGWHPALRYFRDLYNEGRLSIVQNVTYPNPDRSHFRGTDIWLTATDSDVFKSSGWVGRFLETLAPEFPDRLPDEPLAVQIGTTLSLSLQGNRGSLGITFRDPETFYSLVDQQDSSTLYDSAPNTFGGTELEFIRTVERSSQLYSQAVKRAADRQKTNTVTYPANNQLAQSLRIVARLIAGGLSTKFYLVSVGGNVYDTHINQGALTGIHPQLLQELAEAVKLFLDDCRGLGIADRVAGMTFSEFGRRVMENGSRGTDHGTAAPLFVFGEKIIGGQLLGRDPDLANLDSRGDLLMEFDYRQVYAAALLQWFGAPMNTLQSVLFREFAALPLFQQVSSVEPWEDAALLQTLQIAPNPCSVQTVATFVLPTTAHVVLTVHDIRGRQLMAINGGDLSPGPQAILIPTSGLTNGTYFVRLQAGQRQAMKAFFVEH
ncbi:MAG: DUF1501 domain-containing protein [Bacteroidota bacterium]|nr:DUF1501 domain-containing protein [Candidatus Kapabacteria bacterium]MDW8075839.1 DUF1501 domain-containing protein [Bacteroidota bacterium]MDW8271707.1 DUF1501 domain-containing protein [Bacteroidota bacterium]